MNDLKPPIICVGNPRSGTTMVNKCFRQLDTIVVMGELNTLWRTGNMRVGHDRFTAEMATPRAVKRIRKVFLRYQRTNLQRRIFQKTPRNVLRIPFVHKVLPEAKFLHIYRDGRDNASSVFDHWIRPKPFRNKPLLSSLRNTPITDWPFYAPRFLRDYLGIRLGLVKQLGQWGIVYPGMLTDLQHMDIIEVVAKQWEVGIKTAQLDLAEFDPDIWMEVKYEDLVANPLDVFNRIVDFFDLEMTPALEEYIRENIHQDVVGVYKKRFTPEQIAKIDPIVRPTMETLGYDMGAPPAPA